MSEIHIVIVFPYSTFTFFQALDYVFTDIFIEERYLHATEVYRNLLQRSILLDGWMKEVRPLQILITVTLFCWKEELEHVLCCDLNRYNLVYATNFTLQILKIVTANPN